MKQINCRRCELGKYANFVPGKGDVECGLFLIGEAPGADEDKARIPFVGECGQLLDSLKRVAGVTECYTTNICKCKPPNNRKPVQAETMACSAYIEKELVLGRPLVVVAMGKTAIDYFVGSTSVKAARAKRHYWQPDRPFVIVPTYHPSYYLRRGKKPKDMVMCVEDLKHALQCMEVVRQN